MKGRRNTAEEKIRIQRKAERGKSILDLCRDTIFASLCSPVGQHDGWLSRYARMFSK